MSKIIINLNTSLSAVAAFRPPSGPTKRLADRGKQILFDSAEQVNAFFGVFSAVRTNVKASPHDLELAQSVQRALYTIVAPGQSMRIVEVGGDTFLLVLPKGKAEFAEKLLKDGPALRKIIDEADAAADSV